VALDLFDTDGQTDRQTDMKDSLIFSWPCISIYLFININQLDALNFYKKFISSLCMFRAHVLIIRRAKLYYTVSGIITPIGGCPVHRLREDWIPSSPLSISNLVHQVGWY